jgi:hypothetical protein
MNKPGASMLLRTWLQIDLRGLVFASLEDQPMISIFIVVTCLDELVRLSLSLSLSPCMCV